MSKDNKTRLEVQSILRECILIGLNRMGIPETGEGSWQVQEFANATFNNGDRLILLNMIDESTSGWQFEEEGIEADGSKTTYQCRNEIQRWQIHTIAKFKKDASNEDLYAMDMANKLKFWLNGPCTQELRKRGLSIFRIDDYDVLVYNDDSSVYQKRAVLSIKLFVPKKEGFKDKIVNNLHMGIYPV